MGAPVEETVEGKRATVHDVARTAGVSLATVDRVLNARPGVRPETAEKVENAIKALDFRRTMLTLDNYWEWVIEPIRQAPWYNAPRPSDPDVEIWDARAAMLDALYYVPPKKTASA